MSKIILVAAILAVLVLVANAEKPKESKDDGKLVVMKLKKKSPSSQTEVHDTLKELLQSELMKVKTRAKQLRQMKKDRKTVQKMRKTIAKLMRDNGEVRKVKHALKKFDKKDQKRIWKIIKQLNHRNKKAHKRGKGHHKKRGMKKRSGMKKRGMKKKLKLAKLNKGVHGAVKPLKKE